MLLPSALPCDSSQTPPLTRLQSALFASPPASPPQLSAQTAIGNIFTTCRSLQSSLLGGAAPPSSAAPEPVTPPRSSRAQMPTPPLSHAPPPPPLKLRLRSRKPETATGDHGPARKRVVKRTAAAAQPPRGPNKRRRAVDDDMGRYHDDHDHDDDCDASDVDQPPRVLPPDNPFINHDRNENQDKENGPREPSPPHTPKRSRIAPEVLPLGLERSDYHNLHQPSPRAAGAASSGECVPAPGRGGTDVVVEADGETWSTEEDRILVELVLEKLRLSKSDWQDCARSLGKDRGSAARRWRSLMINGDVGLKRTSQRRARIHGTWR